MLDFHPDVLIEKLGQARSTREKNRLLFACISHKHLRREDDGLITFIKTYIWKTLRPNLKRMADYINKTYLERDPIFLTLNNLSVFTIDLEDITSSLDHVFYVWSCGMLIDTEDEIRFDKRDIFTYNVRRVFGSINTYLKIDVTTAIKKITEVYLRSLYIQKDLNINVPNMTSAIRRLTVIS